MSPEQQAFLQVLQESVAVIQQARAEQGWTAGAVALVLVICVLGLGWMVRRLCVRTDKFEDWRQQVLTGQVETTTRALDAAAAGLDQTASVVAKNTDAVYTLTRVIEAAPCGVRLT
jgi:hypothetical protein